MNESWLPVSGLEDIYEVSDAGRVRSINRLTCHSRVSGAVVPRFFPGQVLKLRSRRGASEVHLSVNGAKRWAKVAHLVLEAFVGARPAGAVGVHINGDHSDNSLSNLEWRLPETIVPVAKPGRPRLRRSS